MEPHKLAIAALNQFARNTNERDRAEISKTTNGDTDFTANTFSQQSILSEQSNPVQRSASEQQTQEGFRTDSPRCGSNPPSTIEDSRLSTPPTSTSDNILSREISSQDSAFQHSNIAAGQEPIYHAHTTTLTAGQKRTADGHIKSESPTSSVGLHNYHHSRNISSVSNTSNTKSTKIEELTSGLRTRLSYAMFKVSNGWQSNSIDEVESLASQMGSPSSPLSILQGHCHFHSPPPATIERSKQISSCSGSKTPKIYAEHNTCRLDQPSRTYESFWRDHHVSHNFNHRQSPNMLAKSSPASRILAPPAEICSSYSRSSDKSKKYDKACVKPCYSSNTPGSSVDPQTPQQVESQRSPVIKSSSQTTIQEQDAIETLIFMSSPGNLNNFGHILPHPKVQTSPQKSPLRGELHFQSKAASGRRIGSDKQFRNPQKNDYEVRMQTKLSAPTIHHQDQLRNTTIKSLLDEMGESSSDEGDELILSHGTTSTTTTPHRVAAGRV